MDSIIFDLDGTLWDSTSVVADSWNRVLATRNGNLPVITADMLKQVFGRPLPEIGRILFPALDEADCLELVDACCKSEHDYLLQYPVAPYENTEHTLQVLAQTYRLFIVSNCEQGYIEVFLQTTGLGQYFSGHLCAGDTQQDKGTNIQLLMKTHTIKSAVYVGDTLGDQTASKKAGTPFVHASYGFATVEAPDYSIRTISDLIALFNE
ncbi:MAG: HAD family hydrolase [Lachnospiraceae bacterium]